MMEQLWAEYVAANPRLFEVFDYKAPRRSPRPRWCVGGCQVLAAGKTLHGRTARHRGVSSTRLNSEGGDVLSPLLCVIPVP
jgi:hypothetical protein